MFLIHSLTFFFKTDGEGGFIEPRTVNKVFTCENDVVNKNIVNRMDNSKESILDIERSGNKLLGFKDVIYF